jgi:hypothetical protein
MRSIFLLGIVIALITNINAQGIPIIQWNKAFGGTNQDKAYKIKCTSDSGYIVIGESNSNDYDITGNHGFSDVCVIKLNSTGVIEWQKSYGGTGWDVGKDIVETSEQDYVFVASTRSNDGDVAGNHISSAGTYIDDYWVVKISSSGAILWQNCIGGSSSDAPFGITETRDSGFVIVGTTTSVDGDATGTHDTMGIGIALFDDVFVVKVDRTGNLVWHQSIGGNLGDSGYDISKASDEGFVIAGFSNSYDGQRVSGSPGGGSGWVFKIDSIGNLIWERSQGTIGFEANRSIILTADDGFLINGYSSNAHKSFYTQKIDLSGSTVWTNNYSGIGAGTYDGRSAIQNSFDGFVLGGSIDHPSDGLYHGNKDFLLLGLKSSYDFEWELNFGGSESDVITSIKETADGGLILCGYSNSNDGDLIHSGFHGVNDIWLVKLGYVSSVGKENKSNNDYSEIQIVPNPVDQNLKIIFSSEMLIDASSISLLDMSGNVLVEIPIKDKVEKNIINVSTSALENGMYFISLKTDSELLLRKFQVIHN